MKQYKGKSFIEQELFKIVQSKKTGYPLPDFNDISLALQKAREEIKRMIEDKRDRLGKLEQLLEQLSYKDIYEIIEKVIGK